ARAGGMRVWCGRRTGYPIAGAALNAPAPHRPISRTNAPPGATGAPPPAAAAGPCAGQAPGVGGPGNERVQCMVMLPAGVPSRPRAAGSRGAACLILAVALAVAGCGEAPDTVRGSGTIELDEVDVASQVGG